MNWHRYIRHTFVVVAVLWILWICIAAGAATLKGDQASCSQLGNVIIQAGDVRDSGVPWEAFQSRLNEMIAEARKNPASFVQTDDDAKFVFNALHLVWQNPDDVPFIIATAVYKSCMGK